MAKGSKRASPGIGRVRIGDNSGFPAISDIRTALAVEMVFEEKFKALREQHKRARKTMEGKGVRLDDLTFMKSVKDMTGTEVVDEFKRHWHLVGALFEEQTEQLDIFAPKPSAGPVRQAHFTMGLMQGLRGGELEVPPMVVGDDRQQMIAGYNEGRAKRDEALPLTLAEALQNAENGKTTDGTGKAAAEAAKVNEAAAKDFAEDQKAAGGDDPLVVNGERYATIRQANAARKRLEIQAPATPEVTPEPDADEQDLPADGVTVPDDATSSGGFLNDTSTTVVGDDFRPAEEPPAPPSPPRPAIARPDFHSWNEEWEKWTGPQTMEFRRWFESLGEGVVPAITHPGAVAYFNLLREEQANRASGGPDDDQDEWDAAAPKRQEAELPDEKEVADAAKKLQESGFTQTAKARGRKKGG